jgi:hypothetical protein
MSNTKREDKTMTTIELIKSYTDNDVWTIDCGCNKCIGIDSIRMRVETFAALLDFYEVDIRNAKSFNKFTHNVHQAKRLGTIRV